MQAKAVSSLRTIIMHSIILTSLVVIHAEMPVHAPGVPEPRGLQLWVDLPKQYKMVDPSYQELGPSECVQLIFILRFALF